MTGEVPDLPLYGIEEVRLCAGLSEDALGRRAETTKVLGDLACLDESEFRGDEEGPVELIVISGKPAQILYESIRERAIAGPFSEASAKAQQEADAAQAVQDTRIATRLMIRLGHAA